MRLGWLVLPSHLVDAVVAEKELSDRHSNSLAQLTLATMIESGGYDRHVRAARLRYRRRRDELIHALGNYSTTGIAAGLQVVLNLPDHDEQAVLRHLATHDIATFGMSRFGPDLPPALILGYGAPPQHTWPQTLTALLRALATGAAPASCQG
ncbi:hypothetical protein [Kribbella sp. NPDC023855]|uniref:hypothetical protein n=1 Tax=Kribbella sp. NPDC023855 TaxID=3154698 RepID=UPI0033FD73B3